MASPVDAVRNGSYANAATNAPRSTYIVFRGRARDTELQRALSARHIAATNVVVDEFSIYQLDRRVPPSELASVWALPSP
jgi:hypothetical protein